MMAFESLAADLSVSELDAKRALAFAGHDLNAAATVLLEFEHSTSTQNAAKEDAKKKAAAARAAREARIQRESIPVTDRLNEAARKLAASPAALDVLLTSLRAAVADPQLKRTGRVDVNDEVYRKTVGNAPGGTDMLYACGYQPDGKLMDGELGHLVIKRYDPTLLGQAIAMLEDAQSSEAYTLAKTKIAAEDQEAWARIEAENAAQAKREEYLAKVPPEPEEGGTVYGTSSVTQVDIIISGEDKVVRRFESQDTLVSVQHFIRSLASTPNGPDGVLRVEDVTTYPPRELDLESQSGDTLYALGLWPVARLRVRAVAAAAAASAAERRALAKDGWVVL